MTRTERAYQRTCPVSPDGNPFVHNNLGLYPHNPPTPPADIAERKAYLVGSGIGALLAAAFLVRDGRMPGENITVLEQLAVPGGSFDGAGDTERGFIARGGREMGQHFECFWDIMREIPALEMPAPYTVLDEFRTVNENDPNIDPCRVIHHRGHRRDTYKMGINKKGQRAVVKLLMAKEEETYSRTIEDWFDADFLASNFYTLFKTMFAFQQYESLTEMKRYMHRFLQYFPGFSDLSCLRFSRYNQFESFIVPLTDWLKDRGVVFRYGARVDDLDMLITSGRKVVTAIRLRDGDGEETIEVGERDLVLATIGSCTESTGYGDMDTVPPFHTDRPGGAWTLWRNLARKSAVFGRPDVFCSDPRKTVWESASFSFIGADHPFLTRIRELTGNDPLSGRTVTGGIITAEDSGWCLSLTMNRQPQFRAQPADWGVAWAYGLHPHAPGDCVPKPMIACTGAEVLKEYCYHFGLIDQFKEIRERTKVRLATMPYITSFFMPRRAGDRPEVIPDGCVNLGLLDLDRDVPPIWPAQYDIRALLAAAKTMNDGRLPGEKMLTRFLRGTYYEDILP